MTWWLEFLALIAALCSEEGDEVDGERDLPASLKQGAEQVAREDGTTLNPFIVSAVAEKLPAMRTAQFFEDRAELAAVQQMRPSRS